MVMIFYLVWTAARSLLLRCCKQQQQQNDFLTVSLLSNRHAQDDEFYFRQCLYDRQLHKQFYLEL